MQNLVQAIDEKVKSLQTGLKREELAFGQFIYNNNECQILTQSAEKVEFLFADVHPFEELSITCDFEDDAITVCNSTGEWNRFSYAALLQYQHEIHLLDEKEHLEHKKYSRQGMIKRVMAERMQKALAANYRVEYADNIYGDHWVTNENGVKYKVFLRDFENETGYSNSRDAALNKLGTTKHIMYVFKQLKENPKLYKRLKKTCPFIEIYLDPLNDYRISWFYPHQLPLEAAEIIKKYFRDNSYIEDEGIEAFSGIFSELQLFDNIIVRPEVVQKIDKIWDERSMQLVQQKYKPDYSFIKANLYDYQKEGIDFATCRKAAIIADEMGLGKTIQAIGVALQKKKLFGFKKVLVVCPASLKAQWKSEIEKFSDAKALVVQGFPHEREQIYKNAKETFLIVNYETVLRDQVTISKAAIDLLILDEAQRVKNFATKTAHAIKELESKHTLIITGTPIENKLIDLFSIIGVLDDQFLGPLWEFSYQHCLFDVEKHNKINGYYNLQSLKKKMEGLLIRREKSKVIDQLPQVLQQDIRVGMTSLQADYHASYASAIGQLAHKKFLTPYDMQKMQMLLASMRMVCDSTYLIDDATSDSPKLDELKYILLEKLDVKNTRRKIIIFSEWVKVHKLIGKMLRESNIGFAELNGKVPVNKRGELINRFETNDACKVFLSTEAGGSGLNLQVADILINFELPWNPAKKNQRIGRIDRLGQKSNKLTIFNFITANSIEERISLGLLVKQSLFDGVLNSDSTIDFVDFSHKGRSQFLEQISAMVDGLAQEPTELVEEIEKEEELFEGNADKKESPDEKIFEEMVEEDEDTSPPSEGMLSDKGTLKAKEMEQVMNSGMQFLAGMFQMATGKEVKMEEQKIEVDAKTGEVTMKFKLPV